MGRFLGALILSAIEPMAGKAKGKEEGAVFLLSARQGTKGWGTSFRARGQNCVEYSSVQDNTVSQQQDNQDVGRPGLYWEPQGNGGEGNEINTQQS